MVARARSQRTQLSLPERLSALKAWISSQSIYASWLLSFISYEHGRTSTGRRSASTQTMQWLAGAGGNAPLQGPQPHRLPALLHHRGSPPLEAARRAAAASIGLLHAVANAATHAAAALAAAAAPNVETAALAAPANLCAMCKWPSWCGRIAVLPVASLFPTLTWHPQSTAHLRPMDARHPLCLT